MKPAKESLLASWSTSMMGINWLDELVREGKAVDLGGNGYPMQYLAPASIVIECISSGPPPHKGPFVIGDDYIMPGDWVGEIDIDKSALALCALDELLMIEAWDQS